MASFKPQYSIEGFAPFALLTYSKVHCVSREVVECLEAVMNDKNYKPIKESIDFLLEYFKDITDKISIQIFEDMGFMARKLRYMEQLVTRCLMLSGDVATFFEFLLVCVYICKFSECLCAKHKCYKILKLTADCLVAIYRYKYRLYFEEHGGFLGLVEFCKKLNNLKPLDRRSDEPMKVFLEALSPEWNEKVKIIECLNESFDNIVSLYEIGAEIEDDWPCFISCDRNASPNYLCEWYSSTEIAMDAEMEEWEDVPERISKTGLRCPYCRAKCSQYPNALLKYPDSREEKSLRLVINTSHKNNQY